MNNSQMRVRPAFIWSLLGCFLLALLLSAILPDRNYKTKAMTFYTMNEAKQIASALKQRAIETGKLTNFDNGFIYHALFGANIYHSDRTNVQGEFSDLWKTPYQIEILAQTNFLVHSAGPNKKFGDKDDIIFNSISNGFVKP